MSLFSDNTAWTVLVNWVNGQLTNNKQFLFLIIWTRQHSATRDKHSGVRIITVCMSRLLNLIKFPTHQGIYFHLSTLLRSNPISDDHNFSPVTPYCLMLFLELCLLPRKKEGEYYIFKIIAIFITPCYSCKQVHSIAAKLSRASPSPLIFLYAG